MSKLKPRSDLPEHVKDKLRDLFEHIGLPHFVQRLKQEEILASQEIRLLERKTNLVQAHPQEIAKAIINLVAKQRGLTLERTLLDLARSLDMIGAGRYESLRKAVGEPVAGARNVPQWNREAGELRYRNKVARRINVWRATNICLILDSFQELNWPPRIDSPFRSKTRILTYALENLNNGLSLIKFGSSESGQRVHWYPVS
jgi:hypothetical protein